MKRGIFVDLDNTLIKTKSGKTFPIDDNDWIINDPVVKFIIRLRNSKWFKSSPIIIVTNQGGIEFGYTTEERITNKIDKIRDYLTKNFVGIVLEEAYICKSNNPEDILRKPNPGMGYAASLLLNLDLTKSIMIGDATFKEMHFSDSDRMFAINCDMLGYYHAGDIEKGIIKNLIALENEQS